MTKWTPVLIGFILAVIVKSFFAQYEFIGLLIVGFLLDILLEMECSVVCGMLLLQEH